MIELFVCLSHIGLVRTAPYGFNPQNLLMTSDMLYWTIELHELRW